MQACSGRNNNLKCKCCLVLSKVCCRDPCDYTQAMYYYEAGVYNTMGNSEKLSKHKFLVIPVRGSQHWMFAVVNQLKCIEWVDFHNVSCLLAVVALVQCIHKYRVTLTLIRCLTQFDDHIVHEYFACKPANRARMVCVAESSANLDAFHQPGKCNQSADRRGLCADSPYL